MALPGWTYKKVEIPTNHVFRCLCACGDLAAVGKEFFGFGALPELKGGLKVPDSHQDGTGGNLAMMFVFYDETLKKYFTYCIVTGSGAHKGKLAGTDFVVVTGVDWEAKIIYYCPLGKREPSTDILLVIMAFETDPSLRAWIHVHRAVDTPHKLKINYPAVTKADREALGRVVEIGAEAVNLVDHDILKDPNDEPDSVIILGKTIEEARELALRLIPRLQN